LKNETDMIHIFKDKHKLEPLVSKLGWKEEFITAVLNKANTKFPSSWLFNKINPVIIELEWYTVYIRWSIVNWIPRIWTIYIP
jgi:hypothetical protein